jgi:hypothetical protein
VLKWPDPATVERELRAWAQSECERRPGLLRLGYFGSYARGDAGVGSDLDLVAVVRESQEAFERRSIGWDLGPLPVPAEIIVYTKEEWASLLAEGGRFARMLRDEVIWIVAGQ